MKPRCSCPRVLAWWAFLKQLQNYFSQAPEKCPEAGRGNSSKWGVAAEAQPPALTLSGLWLEREKEKWR